MKILHTADWHFGKQLYKYSLATEMSLFTNWVLETITSENINVLLISGDVFDITNPANVDKEFYFSFLKAVRALEITTIITGGNHDSINFLNSSKEYLKLDKIHIIGGATTELEDEVFYFEENGESVVICAVPFLRDKDLRNINSDAEFSSRQESIKFGLKTHYQNLLELAKNKYPNTPIIGMGHLFAIGSSTSDSERDIHIGNSGAVSHEIFEGYDYIALGHIHKPQIINGNEMIRYSGSPIALSFSEKTDIKQIVVLTIDNNQINKPQVIKVPKNRELLRFSGTLEGVKNAIATTDLNKTKLPAYIELQVQEEQYNLSTIQDKDLFIRSFNEENEAKIIFNQIKFNQGSKDITSLIQDGRSIENLEPEEVLKMMITSKEPDSSEAYQQELMDTFKELLEGYHGE